MHLTQDDSVWLLSSTTVHALPVKVNKPAWVAETPTPSIKRTSSIEEAFHNRPGRPAEVAAWKKFLDGCLIQDFFFFCICSISRGFHTESSPRSHFTLVSRFGSAILHTVWWCCVTADCHTQLILLSKSRDEGEQRLYNSTQHYLFKRASQLTLGQKHFAAIQSYSSWEIEFVGQSVW